MKTENTNFYLFENLSGNYPVGLVGARETTPEVAKHFAEQGGLFSRGFGDNITYRTVPESRHRAAEKELRLKDSNPVVKSMRTGARTLDSQPQ